MTRTTTSRPRMAVIYAPGTVRARRWHGDGDVRGYRPPSGWTARADLTDIHPTTRHALPHAAWWIIETKEQPSSAPRPGRSALGAVNAKIRARQSPRPGLKAQQPNQNAAAFTRTHAAALKQPGIQPAVTGLHGPHT